MRMRVGFGNLAMRGPARMSNAEVALVTEIEADASKVARVEQLAFYSEVGFKGNCSAPSLMPNPR